MTESILTYHAKNRYVERVGSRDKMQHNIEMAERFGLKGVDVPMEYEPVKRFLSNNKIYYNGYVYIYANTKSKQYHTLLTVYEYQDSILQSLQTRKYNNIKINNIKLEKMDLRQVFVSFGNEIYNAIFNYDKIAVFHKVDEKDKCYVFPRVKGIEIHNNLAAFLSKYHNGKIKRFNFEIDYSFFTPEEKVVYRAISLIPYGQTLTYNELLDSIHLEMTLQKLSKIIKECPIDYFIPTHRVVKSNGCVGSHRDGSDFKKKLRKIERDTLLKEKKIREDEKRRDMKFNENLCYNICNLFNE